MAEPLLPCTNADAVPVVPMSAAQKYTFDLKGWISLPGLLEKEQLESIRAHQMKFLYERDALSPEEKDNHGGPSQVLLDHPAVVGVLNEVLSHQALAGEDCYGFRYDHTYTSHRPAGSAVIFTEGLCHSGTRWNNAERDRLCLFTCYDMVNSKWGKGCPPAEVIAAMPPKRQTLFRGAWHGMGDVPGINRYYEEENRAV